VEEELVGRRVCNCDVPRLVCTCQQDKVRDHMSMCVDVDVCVCRRGYGGVSRWMRSGDGTLGNRQHDGCWSLEDINDCPDLSEREALSN
jgi:hypothetical protein